MDFSDIITGFTDSKKREQKFENDNFKIVLKSGIKLIRILILFLKKKYFKLTTGKCSLSSKNYFINELYLNQVLLIPKT